MATIDLSLPPDEVLIRRINESYGKNFSLDDVYFDRDTLAKIDYRGCDTTVVLRARPNTGWSGAVRIYYNRINLTKYLDGVSVLVPPPVAFTGDARPVVLRELGIRLDPIDIISDVVPIDAVDDLLRISGQSLVYAGVIHLKYVEVLTDRLQNTLLNGFYANSVEVPL
jgi:hypothetical protein